MLIDLNEDTLADLVNQNNRLLCNFLLHGVVIAES
jgi:hypothetical protein